MLRKVATHARDGDVWVDGGTCVANSDLVTVLRREGEFAWVRTSDGIEGYLKLSYLDGAPAPKPDAVMATYKFCQKSQIRAGFDMASDKTGILAKGDIVDSFEERVNDAGTTRVRFAQGWVSMKAGNGSVVLEPVGEAAPGPAPAADVAIGRGIPRITPGAEAERIVAWAEQARDQGAKTVSIKSSSKALKKLKGDYTLDSDFKKRSMSRRPSNARCEPDSQPDWPAPAFPTFVKSHKGKPTFCLQFNIAKGAWFIVEINADGSAGRSMAESMSPRAGGTDRGGAIVCGVTSWNVDGVYNRQVGVAITTRRDYSMPKDQAELKPQLKRIKATVTKLEQLGDRLACAQLVTDAHDPPNRDVAGGIAADPELLYCTAAWKRVASTTKGQAATPADIAREQPFASLKLQALSEFSDGLTSALVEIKTRGKTFTQEERWDAPMEAGQKALHGMKSDWQVGFASLNDLCRNTMEGLTSSALSSYLVPSAELRGKL